MGTGRDVDAKDNRFKVILKSLFNSYTPTISRDFFQDFDVQTIETLTNLVNKFLYRKRINFIKTSNSLCDTRTSGLDRKTEITYVKKKNCRCIATRNMFY